MKTEIERLRAEIERLRAELTAAEHQSTAQRDRAKRAEAEIAETRAENERLRAELESATRPASSEPLRLSEAGTAAFKAIPVEPAEPTKREHECDNEDCQRCFHLAPLGIVAPAESGET